MHRFHFALYGALAVLVLATPVFAQDEGFDRWLLTFKAKALAEGISPPVVDEALTGLVLDPTVVRLDGKQPEKKVTLARYLQNTITPRRIAKGRAMMEEHAEILDAVSKRYGVQPNYIVALWAIESDFGSQQGDFSVVRSLATLAYDGRRAAFFEKELLKALIIIESDSIPASELRGSWAGAMGNCQFMPSTYLRYAIDANGDGKRDIWGTPEDVFASIANYLSSIGWDDSYGWGREAIFPEGFTEREASIKNAHPAHYYAKHGIRYAGGSLPDSDYVLYAIYPGKPDEGGLLVTDNYQALLQWNRSRYFATAVGKLADAIGER